MPDQNNVSGEKIKKEEGLNEESNDLGILSNSLEEHKKDKNGADKREEKEPIIGEGEVTIEKGEGVERSADLEQSELKKELVEEKIDQQQKTQAAKDDDQGQDEEKDKKQVKEHAKEISAVQDADEQIGKLVNLAVQKDPYTAIKVAKELDNNYVLDKVHDELIEDKTRKILLEKGLLEE